MQMHNQTDLVRVEVRVKDDHSIGTPQIDTDTASPCRQYKYEYFRIFLVKFIHILLAIRLLGITVLITYRQ